VLVNVPTVVELKVVVVISLVKFAGVGCPSNTAVNVLQSAEIVTLVMEVIAIEVNLNVKIIKSRGFDSPTFKF
jgi:hypothetical protein